MESCIPYLLQVVLTTFPWKRHLLTSLIYWWRTSLDELVSETVFLVWNSCFLQIAPSIHFPLLLWKFTTQSLLKRTQICLGQKQNPSLRWGKACNFGAVMGNRLRAFSAFISPPCPLTSGSFYQKFCKIHQILGICPYWVSPISSKNES